MAAKIRKFSQEEFEKKLAASVFVKRAAREAARKSLYYYKMKFLKQFENHPVTKEIEAGESASNISGTLGGYGNLFSFLGFFSGDNPTAPVKNAIRNVKLTNDVVQVRGTKANPIFRWRVDTSSLASLPEKTKLPWESGRSWLLAIEAGISGFSNYISGIFSKKYSRSGTGLQNLRSIRRASFKRVDYFLKMYSDFVKSMRKGTS